jgi:hypothetical protein
MGVSRVDYRDFVVQLVALLKVNSRIAPRPARAVNA